jgi:hypothetical protein
VTSGAPAQYGMNTGASVNAVTKSGTNSVHGNGFEFLRDKRFNATNPFAAIGPDGKRRDDGLKRNQFGGTIGGPVVKDQLFYFGGYQATPTRVAPAANIAFVPTAAMLRGDFTDITSPACNNGRQIALRAPFVNNTISPTQFSPAALNLAKRLPTTDDPCGKTTFQQVDNRDEIQYVTRVDYQRGPNHSIFGRYLAQTDDKPAALNFSDNILVSTLPGFRGVAQAATFGDTRILSANSVNTARFAFNRTTGEPEEQGLLPAVGSREQCVQLLADEGNAHHGDGRIQHRRRDVHAWHRGHQHLHVQRRSDARSRAASARVRRCARPLAFIQQHVGARRWHLDVFGDRDRTWPGGPPARPGRLA